MTAGSNYSEQIALLVDAIRKAERAYQEHNGQPGWRAAFVAGHLYAQGVRLDRELGCGYLPPPVLSMEDSVEAVEGWKEQRPCS